MPHHPLTHINHTLLCHRTLATLNNLAEISIGRVGIYACPYSALAEVRNATPLRQLDPAAYRAVILCLLPSIKRVLGDDFCNDVHLRVAYDTLCRWMYGTVSDEDMRGVMNAVAQVSDDIRAMRIKSDVVLTNAYLALENIMTFACLGAWSASDHAAHLLANGDAKREEREAGALDVSWGAYIHRALDRQRRDIVDTYAAFLHHRLAQAPESPSW